MYVVRMLHLMAYSSLLPLDSSASLCLRPSDFDCQSSQLSIEQMAQCTEGQDREVAPLQVFQCMILEFKDTHWILYPGMIKSRQDP